MWYFVLREFGPSVANVARMCLRCTSSCALWSFVLWSMAVFKLGPTQHIQRLAALKIWFYAYVIRRISRALLLFGLARRVPFSWVVRIAMHDGSDLGSTITPRRLTYMCFLRHHVDSLWTMLFCFLINLFEKRLLYPTFYRDLFPFCALKSKMCCVYVIMSYM